MAGNRSRFSKYYMTGGPVFSVNFTNRKNLAKLNYHMPIKKSQAKCTEYRTAGHLVFWQKLWPAVELKKVLSVTKHGFVFWAQCKPNARLTFLIDTWSFSLAGFFSICEVYWECRTAGHLVFWKPWPAVELKKVLSVTKHGFVFWAQRKPLRYTWGLYIECLRTIQIVETSASGRLASYCCYIPNSFTNKVWVKTEPRRVLK